MHLHSVIYLCSSTSRNVCAKVLAHGKTYWAKLKIHAFMQGCFQKGYFCTRRSSPFVQGQWSHMIYDHVKILAIKARCSRQHIYKSQIWSCQTSVKRSFIPYYIRADVKFKDFSCLQSTTIQDQKYVLLQSGSRVDDSDPS